MLYLFPSRVNIEALVLDNNDRNEAVFLPLFYLGKWVDVYQVNKNEEVPDSLHYNHLTRYQKRIQSIDALKQIPGTKYPQYILFYGDIDLEKRINNMKNYYPDLTYETSIEPSNLDKLLFWLNPRNVNQEIFIYRTQIHAF